MRSAVRTTRAAGCPPAASIASAAIRVAAAVYLVAAALVLGSRTPAGASIVACELGLAGLLVAMSVVQVRVCEGLGSSRALAWADVGVAVSAAAALAYAGHAAQGAALVTLGLAELAILSGRLVASGAWVLVAGGGWLTERVLLPDAGGAGVSGPSLGVRLGVAGGVAMVAGTLAVELSRRRRRLQELVDGLDAVVWEIDVARSRTVFVSGGTERMTGCTGEELLGPADAFLDRLVNPADRPLVDARHAEAIATGLDVGYEFRAAGRAASGRWLHATASVHKDANGRVQRLRAVANDISYLRLAEHELERERERFRLLATSAPVGILEMDAEGRCQFINERCCEILGHGPRELVGTIPTDWVHPSDRERVREEWAGAVRLGGEFVSECRFRRPDGSVAWAYTTGTIMREPDGSMAGAVGTVTDITDQRRAQAERELVLAQARESAEQAEQGRALLNGLFDTAPVGRAFLGPDRRFVRANRAFAEIIGVPPEQHVGYRLSELAPATAPYEQIMQRVLETREPVMGVASQPDETAASGRHYVYSFYPVEAAGGRMLGVGVVVSDVTDFKHAEQALREAEQRQRLITDNLTDVVFHYDMQRVLSYVTPSYERLTGYTADELRAAPMRDVHPDDVERMRELWRGLWQGRPYSGVEFRVVTKAGDVRWLWSTGAPVMDEAGVQVGVQIRDADVTLRKRAEARLRASEERARSIVETASEAFAATDGRGQVTEWNRAAELLFGWGRSAVLGVELPELVASGEHARLLADVIKAGAGGAGQGLRDRELVLHTHAGRSFPAEVTLWASGSGVDVCLNLFCHDITERKQREQQVEHMAFHDHLTGLANRTLFEQHLQQALASAGQASQQVALLYIDLDRFKHVNDTYGHESGDALLRQVADRLSTAARANDLVVRLGGDEFVMVLRDLAQGAGPRVAETVAERVQEGFREVFGVGAATLDVTASIGIALYPDHARDAASLLRAADRGMYESKRQGLGYYRVAEAA